MNKLTLRSVNNKDIALIDSWLKKEYILKWYYDADEWLHEVDERHGSFSWIHHFIVMDGFTPVGFCQYYDCYDAKEMEEWYCVDRRDDTFSIDYLIGDESYLGKGYGKAVVHLITDTVKNMEKANRIIVQPEKDNRSSIHALIANGYVFDEQHEYYYKLMN